VCPGRSPCRHHYGEELRKVDASRTQQLADEVIVGMQKIGGKVIGDRNASALESSQFDLLRDTIEDGGGRA
jgi:hypothetical protein